MKSFTLLLSCFLLVAACVRADEPERLCILSKELLRGCAKEAGVEPGDLRKLLDSHDKPQLDEAIQKLSCLRACAFKKAGFMKAGKLMVENIKNVVSKFPKLPISIIDELKTRTEYCIEEAHKEDGDCTVVRKFVDCFHPYVEQETQHE